MPSLRLHKSPSVAPGVLVETARTLPSQSMNWQMPGCQLPKTAALASNGPLASGYDAPPNRPTVSRLSPL